jgi:hypothetical protein
MITGHLKGTAGLVLLFAASVGKRKSCRGRSEAPELSKNAVSGVGGNGWVA